MKKIYVIGAKSELEARTIADIPKDIEVIIVSDVSSIPIVERLKSTTREIKQLEMPNIDLLPYTFERGKGHERKYKYHR